MAKRLETLLKVGVLNAELGPKIDYLTATDIATAGAVTLTAAQILGGQINRDCAGSGRTDTLPTAALLVAALRANLNLYGGQLPAVLSFDFVVQNDSDANEVITIAIGTGGTIATCVATTPQNQVVTVAQNASRRFNILITNSTVGSEAYTLRNRGTWTT